MKSGYAAQLANQNIQQPGSSLTGSPVGGTTYVEGTDYTLKRRLGLVQVIAGRSLATAVAGAPTSPSR